MNAKLGVIAISMLSAVKASAADPPAPQSGPASAPGSAPASAPPSGPLAQAVLAKFGECHTAEGAAPLSEADQAALAGATAMLVDAIRPTLAGEDACATDAACAGRVQALTCDQLSGRMAGTMPDLMPADTDPPPEWALRLISAMTGKASACYTTEIGRPTTAEEAAKLSALGPPLARALGGMTASGRCKLRTEKFAACMQAVEAQTCAALAVSFQPPPGLVPGSAPSPGSNANSAPPSPSPPPPDDLPAELEGLSVPGAAPAAIPGLPPPCPEILECDPGAGLDRYEKELRDR